MGQHRYPIYKIPKVSNYQFAIVPGLKSFQVNSLSFCLRQIGVTHISTHPADQENPADIDALEQPSSCWLTFSLLPDSLELIGRHIGGKNVSAMCFQKNQDMIQ